MCSRLAVPLLAIAFLGANGQTPGVPAREPITPEQRLKWFVNASVGPAPLLGGLVSAGMDTLRNSPEEYGPHVAGYGRRYGLRISERAVSSGLEVGIGALWGEDPRYYRVPDRNFSGRVRNVIRMTFITHDGSGREMPAYARFVAYPAAGFVSNLWVPDSQHSTGDALNRIGVIFANQMAGNAFTEFWPDVRRRVFRRHGSPSGPGNNLSNGPSNKPAANR